MKRERRTLHLNFNREADEQHEHRSEAAKREKVKRTREVEDC